METRVLLELSPGVQGSAERVMGAAGVQAPPMHAQPLRFALPLCMLEALQAHPARPSPFTLCFCWTRLRLKPPVMHPPDCTHPLTIIPDGAGGSSGAFANCGYACESPRSKPCPLPCTTPHPQAHPEAALTALAAHDAP